MLEQGYGSRVGSSDFCSVHVSFLILILLNPRGKGGLGRLRAINTGTAKKHLGKKKKETLG